MMEKLRLKKFFWCFSVRTGSLLIGTLGWIGTVSESLIEVEYLMKHEIDDESSIVVSRRSISTSILSIVLSVALVFGVYKRRRSCMLPWLVIHFISTSFLTFGFCMMLFMLPKESTNEILVLLLVGIATGLSWYCFLCVWTYYQDIGEEREEMVQIPVTVDPNPPSYDEVVRNNAEQNFGKPVHMVLNIQKV